MRSLVSSSITRELFHPPARVPRCFDGWLPMRVEDAGFKEEVPVYQISHTFTAVVGKEGIECCRKVREYVFFFHGRDTDALGSFAQTEDMHERMRVTVHDILLSREESCVLETVFVKFEYPGYGPNACKVEKVTPSMINTWCHNAALIVQEMIRESKQQTEVETFYAMWGASLGCGFALKTLSYLAKKNQAQEFDRIILSGLFLSVAGMAAHLAPWTTWMVEMCFGTEEFEYFDNASVISYLERVFTREKKPDMFVIVGRRDTMMRGEYDKILEIEQAAHILHEVVLVDTTHSGLIQDPAALNITAEILVVPIVAS